MVLSIREPRDPFFMTIPIRITELAPEPGPL